MRLKALLTCLGVGRSTVYDRMNPKSPRYDASFPRPIRLSSGGGGRGAVGWLESDVSLWLAARVSESASEFRRRGRVDE
ncbi:helix-turn-helix transcriptional regulator [Aquipseudomonas alcaligenes]|nr:AlpA family phage regulatory protein [Pseudomonas alcaligenes]